MLDEVPTTHTVRLSRCDRLGQPVVALLPPSIYKDPYSAGLFSELQQRHSFSVFPEFAPSGQASIHSVTQLLWSELASPILDGRFSFCRTNKVYVPFKTDENTLIVNAQESEFDENA